MNRRTALFALALPLTWGLAGPVRAKARWQYFNEDPAYPTRQAALADAPNVFARVGWPKQVIAALAEKMKSPGELIELENGDELDFMRTGKTGLWRNVLVDFKRPATGMRYVADAEKWTHVHDGFTYEAIVPKVCNNLSGRRIAGPEEDCAYILFEAGEGDAFASVGILGDFDRHSDCPPAYNGPGAGKYGWSFEPGGWKPLKECAELVCLGWGEVEKHYGQTATQTGSFRVSPGTWAVRVPTSVAKSAGNRVVLCLTKEDGVTTTLSMGVQHFDYQLMAGKRFAVIWYTRGRVPASYRTRSYDTNLWWRWSNGAEYASR